MCIWYYTIMAPIGDGFVKSIMHKHFLKVFVSFIVILTLGYFSYNYWIKDQATLQTQPQQQYQAR